MTLSNDKEADVYEEQRWCRWWRLRGPHGGDESGATDGGGDDEGDVCDSDEQVVNGGNGGHIHYVWGDEGVN